MQVIVTSLVMVTIHTADSVAAGVAACRLISSNVVLSGLSFSINVVRKRVMLSVRAVYVLGSLHLRTTIYSNRGVLGHSRPGACNKLCINTGNGQVLPNLCIRIYSVTRCSPILHRKACRMLRSN